MSNALTVSDNTRNALLPIGITDLTFKLGGEVGFKVDDYDLDDTDLNKVISRARDIARFGIPNLREKIELDQRLSASDEAVVDLAAASIIYVTAAMGYEALLKLADETYRNGKFFLIPGSPVLVASANGPTLAFKADGSQLTIEDDMAQKAWDYWVDQLCVIIKRENKEISNAQISNTKSDLKRRWKRLVDPLIDKPVIVQAVVSRKDIDTYIIDGQEVATEWVSDDIQRAFRGVPMGEEKPFVEEITADWVLENSSAIREMGSYVGSLNTKTEEGREAFEDALKTYSLLSVHGFRAYLRGDDLKKDESKIEAFIQAIREVDPATGAITIRKMIMVPVDDKTNQRWVTTQISARYAVVETQLVA